MNIRNAVLIAPLAAAMACGGANGTAGSGSAALDAATPSYAALSMDQVSTDATISAAAPSALTAALQSDLMMSGDGCHPHLFLRQREVVERVNRHIYKALQHVEVVIARNPLSSTDTTRTWENVANGIDRKFTITLLSADVYSWELDDGPAGTTPLPVVMTGYYRELGKGGSLKFQDQMVFACPANPSLVPANAQLVSRWYKASDATIHGRSDALMTGGQLAAPVDHAVGATCHVGAQEGDDQREGFWLMKAEDASGATLSGESSLHLGESVTPCDPIFGAVPELSDNVNDFTGWPSSYSDGTPFPFPNM